MASLVTYPRRGLHGEVVHSIGLRIVSGDILPGEPLPPEDELVGDLSVSRTVVREAVRVLAAKGLVEARPKTGTRVRPRSDWNIGDPDVLSWRLETSGDHHQLFGETIEIRLALEPLAARLAAARATDEEIAGITEALEGMKAGVGTQAAYLASDLLFHDRILAACHNELLGHLGGVLRGVLRKTFEFTTTPATSRRRALPLHAAIIDAIRDRDGDEAETAARTLIADTITDLERARRRTRAGTRGR